MKPSSDFLTPIVFSVISFIISILVLGLISSQVFLNPRISDLGLFEAWNIWDAPHYLDLATNWYVADGEDANWIVFLPFYPFSVRAADFILPIGILYSGYLVSFIFAVIAAITFYKLVLIDDKKDAKFALGAILLFPTSFFLFLPYPESLFLALVLLTFYFSRKGSFILASLFAMLATGTKIAGLALIPVIFTEIILHHIKFSKQANFFKMILVLNLPILGFLFYLWVNYQTFGDIFYFQRAQSINWGTNFSPVISGFNQAWNFRTDPEAETALYLGYGQLISFILSVLTTIYAFFKLRKSYFIYSAAFLVIYSSMSFWLSFPRYILSLFPLFIIVGHFSRNRMFAILWFTLSIILMFVFGTIALEHGNVL